MANLSRLILRAGWPGSSLSRYASTSIPTSLGVSRYSMVRSIRPTPFVHTGSPILKSTYKTLFDDFFTSASITSSRKSSILPRLDGQPLTPVYAAMPQLVPFFFVNEVTYAFIFFSALVYIMSKYILPRHVRLMCARLFISKL